MTTKLSNEEFDKLCDDLSLKLTIQLQEAIKATELGPKDRDAMALTVVTDLAGKILGACKLKYGKQHFHKFLNKMTTDVHSIADEFAEAPSLN